MFCSGVVGEVYGDDRTILCNYKLKNNEYERVVKIARSQVGVREEGGENCGVAVKGYLGYVGIGSPAPWCAAWVSWVFGQAGYVQPRTAWCPALFPKEREIEIDARRMTKQSQVSGLVFGIYFPSKGRIAHCGIVERVQGDFVMGIEGNTNVAGSRDGDRVMRRLRHKRTIAKYADWLN